MPQQSPSKPLAPHVRWSGRVGAVMVAAALLSLPLADSGRERNRGRSYAAAADPGWVAAPTVCADMTACPEVTSPVATVARFSVLPLAMVATVVDVRVVHEVAVSRIGGLYGP